ncbi:MAG: xanthine dehydrogenase family protein subunit M [Candidatus Eremiobacteraeota bacterium]|nr:xanthine dehydrogenase family protein subunit M [Candidatus Eremiobacteraeota bacterium]
MRQAFDFVREEDAAAARAALAAPGSYAVAGGTSLIDLMKVGVERPTRIVDINRLPLAAIERREGTIRIGALARNSDVAYDPLIAESFPALSRALLSGASAQLRNMATVGGNVLQRTRCTYFRDTAWPCNKRMPGSGCSAIGGFDRNHAILGTSDACIATNPSDMNVALAALDATLIVHGDAGERRIAFTDVHRSPGQTPHLETILEAGDLIVAVDIPATPFFRNSTYLKVRDRASYAFALAGAAVALDLQGGTIANARVALGGVATKPWRSGAAEATLVGNAPSKALFRAAGEAAFREAVPQRDNGFKIELGTKVVARALALVGGTLR